MGGNVERKVRVAEVTLRCVLCGLGTLAAALVATDKQTRTFFTMQKTAAFTDVRALVVLVAANAVAAGYSLLQAARCLFFFGSSVGLRSSRAIAWCVFSGDQALAYVALGAAAAALQASVVSKRGLPAFQWMEVCGLYGAFCRKAGGGIACAVAGVLAAVALAFISAFNLFRLYGKKKNGGATTW
ncbi:hypothetical protein PR202_gb23706 [Eleusine coracana subsp. coracana]|uniref:CASP-like protein n=1 Tax=Eleusine coracana subsp. coracana TaxID=191504 RepID=A0AAV5FJL1_ELECO|nr:hypothetical protein QOZ80_5BG0439020 [Eleusine coracana subsp. coracana]GJN34986.1 hypothetical protein PR202_gb23706 [Eleusine coracana subsp. coracana]